MLQRKVKLRLTSKCSNLEGKTSSFTLGGLCLMYKETVDFYTFYMNYAWSTLFSYSPEILDTVSDEMVKVTQVDIKRPTRQAT